MTDAWILIVVSWLFRTWFYFSVLLWLNTLRGVRTLHFEDSNW